METVIMGLIRKAARAQAKAAEAEAGLAETGLAETGLAETGLAEAEAKVAQEQAAAIARALHEDEVHRHADLEEVAEKEAEAVPWSRQAAADAGMQAAPDRKEHSSLCPLISGADGRPPAPRHPRQPRSVPPASDRRPPEIGPNDIDGTSMLPGRHQWDIDVVSGRPSARVRSRQPGLAGLVRSAGRTGRAGPRAGRFRSVVEA
jgi:hypothetical protein